MATIYFRVLGRLFGHFQARQAEFTVSDTCLYSKGLNKCSNLWLVIDYVASLANNACETTTSGEETKQRRAQTSNTL